MLEEETQVENTEPTPQVEVTDNQSEAATLKEENLKLKQTVTRHANKEHELRQRNEEISLRLDGQEDVNAQILDRLDALASDDNESKSGHVEELRQKRAQAPNPANAAKAKFEGYLAAKGLDMNDSFVIEAVKGSDSVEEGIANINKALKDVEDKSISKQVADKVKLETQRILKDMGVAKSEVSPNTGGSMRLTSEQLRKMSASEFKEKLDKGEISV